MHAKPGQGRKMAESPSTSSEGIQVGIHFLVEKKIGASMPCALTVTQVLIIY